MADAEDQGQDRKSDQEQEPPRQGEVIPPAQAVADAPSEESETEAGKAEKVKKDTKADTKAKKDGKSKKPRGLFTVPWWGYVLVFILVNAFAVIVMQWAASGQVKQAWEFFSKMFLYPRGEFQFVNNFLILGVIYLVLIVLINRFWAASGAYLSLICLIALIDRMKVLVRNEAITPADLTFVSGGNTDNLTQFIPAGSARPIICVICLILGVIVAAVLCGKIDKRKSLINPANKGLGLVARLLVVILPAAFGFSFVMSMSTTDSWANKAMASLGDKAHQWNNLIDANDNGVVVTFMRNVNPKIMTEPDGYSQETMTRLARKYSAQAAEINKTRSQNLNDSTVIMVLSESLADPTRVPGISLNKDPLPYIKSLKASTTSGLMLSSGYGGGTANLEYQALTGLSMSNFDSSLTAPYQQLVPGEAWTPTFNQAWPSSQTLAVHPYVSTMYSRRTNYKKFGFSAFYTKDGPQYVKYKGTLGTSPYVSDEQAYKETLEKVHGAADAKSQFIQLVTMQNHMPYNQWYKDNEFVVKSSTDQPLSQQEASSIQTYAKGAEITDQATRGFIESLDKMDKPITVIFYGDHLPGIYSTASQDSRNSVILHESDYFIWSNKASKVNKRLPENLAAYTSPNFFMAEATQQMDAKVSPYTAFLTKMHEQVAAMEPPVINQIQGWTRIPAGQALYLDPQGKLMDISRAPRKTKELLEDYKLIQYDITAGKNYLEGTGFMDYPKAGK